MRSFTPQIDLKLIRNEEASTSIGGTYIAAALCNMLAIPLSVKTPQEENSLRWDTNCVDSKLVVRSWCLT